MEVVVVDHWWTSGGCYHVRQYTTWLGAAGRRPRFHPAEARNVAEPQAAAPQDACLGISMSKVRGYDSYERASLGSLITLM